MGWRLCQPLFFVPPTRQLARVVDGLDAAVTKLLTVLVSLTTEGECTRTDLATLQARVATLHATPSTCTPGWARELELRMKLHQMEQAMHREHRELCE